MEGAQERPGVGRTEAAASLAAAKEAADRMRRKASWYAVYCIAFGTVIPTGTLVIGLNPSSAVRTAAIALMAVAIAALVVYAVTRPVTAPWFGRLHTAVMLSWGLLYSATMLIGKPLFPGDPAWWAPMSAATAVPFAVAAVWVLRTARGDR